MAANLNVFKNFVSYPNQKIVLQKFIRWNLELDERKNIFDIMGTRRSYIVSISVLINIFL